jgi:hypothetical protein
MAADGPSNELAERFERAAGPLTWVDDETAIGRLGEREVRLSSSPGAVEVSTDLGERKIAMTIDRRADTEPTRPVAPTGDQGFDDRYLVQGWPAAACRKGLDPAARAWIAETWPDRTPDLSAEGGALRARLDADPPRGRGEDPADALAQDVERIAALADGLISGYDRERSSVVARSGDEAARAWEAALEQRPTTERQRRAAVVALVVAGGVIIGLGLIGAVLAAAGVF